MWCALRVFSRVQGPMIDYDQTSECVVLNGDSELTMTLEQATGIQTTQMEPTLGDEDVGALRQALYTPHDGLTLMS